jgi:guanosine-3',5'-bis(diphosphate) 3'-pyrophosphohydrolase
MSFVSSPTEQQQLASGEILERAILFATNALAGQRYPSPEREPSILHAIRVTVAVDGLAAQTAAILHDVLEDTETTADDLREIGISADIVDAVIALTHDPAETYEEYTQRVARNAVARDIKLADLADNLRNNRRLAPTPDVLERIERYERAQELLLRR